LINEAKQWLISVRPKDGNPFRLVKWALDIPEVIAVIDSEYGLQTFEKLEIEKV
jgi:hypothetical protein